MTPAAPPELFGGPVAILGWGSLLWDLDTLARHVSEPWRPGVGPVLPIEFSRVSAKRRNGLALVIDPQDGAPCVTHVLPHAGPLTEAWRALAERERAPEGRIGWATPAEMAYPGAPADSPEAVATAAVQAWLPESGFTAAVWTALPRNFESVTGAPFDLGAAEAHLQSLEGEDLAEAIRYIQRAPRETDTPLRRRLTQRRGWHKRVKET